MIVAEFPKIAFAFSRSQFLTILSADWSSWLSVSSECKCLRKCRHFMYGCELLFQIFHKIFYVTQRSLDGSVEVKLAHPFTCSFLRAVSLLKRASDFLEDFKPLLQISQSFIRSQTRVKSSSVVKRLLSKVIKCRRHQFVSLDLAIGALWLDFSSRVVS